MTFRELSEGERQLLTVLGLLRFTAEDESLILLDEPDTHLNPIWSVKYLQFLSEFIGGTSSGQETSHVIMTTHNPIAIAELSKEQVQIPQVRDGRKVAATFPDEDPRGMGYASIVTSSMFGIPSYLDAPTQLDLERQRQLSHQASRTAAEDADLEEVTARLDKLGFRFFVPDDEYSRFLRLRSRALEAVSETRDANRIARRVVDMSLQERDELAKRILSEIAAEARSPANEAYHR